jgi:serine/threonine protein kinase
MGGLVGKSNEGSSKPDYTFFRGQMINSHKAFSIEVEYELQGKLGEGTSAIVLRGRSKRSGKSCAIKSVDKLKGKGIAVLLENEFGILR